MKETRRDHKQTAISTYLHSEAEGDDDEEQQPNVCSPRALHHQLMRPVRVSQARIRQHEEQRDRVREQPGGGEEHHRHGSRRVRRIARRPVVPEQARAQREGLGGEGEQVERRIGAGRVARGLRRRRGEDGARLGSSPSLKGRVEALPRRPPRGRAGLGRGERPRRLEDQGRFREGSGKVQGRFREGSGKLQGAVRGLVAS